MSSTATYGGSCPCCKRAMLQYYSSGSCGAKWDACAWCGFAYATTYRGLTCESDMGEERGTEVWSWLAPHALTGDGLGPEDGGREAVLAGMKANPKGWPEFSSEAESEFWPSIFDYTKDTPEELNRCQV